MLIKALYYIKIDDDSIAYMYNSNQNYIKKIKPYCIVYVYMYIYIHIIYSMV